MTNKLNTTRFSDRVNDYIKYRPSYPQALIDALKNEIDLQPKKIIADIGSGTGISSYYFSGTKTTCLQLSRTKK